MSEEKLWDGIAQADNKLPAWYVISFIGTIVYAVVYLIFYHIATDWSQDGQYTEEVQAYNAEFKSVVASASKGPVVTDHNPYAGDKAHIAEGEKIFKSTCAVCHGQDAKGMIGPDLTDKVWLHGNTEAIVFDTVWNGVEGDKILQNPSKGPMTPKGGADLNEEQVWSVIAYLEATFKNITSGK